MTIDQRFGRFNHSFKLQDDNFINLYLCNAKICEIVSRERYKTDIDGERKINKNF